MVLKGRLGLETARVPYADRHGCMWLRRGSLYVEDGTLRFTASTSETLAGGDYAIPFQTLTTLILEPGTSVTHDALRICARHGTALIFTGEGGVRMYASLPTGADRSKLARRQVELWADPDWRVFVARQMYGLRLGEILPAEDIAALRGMEGARVKAAYRRMAESHGIPWHGRRYDRSDPESADPVNQALNSTTAALTSAARVAVAATSTIPQLGFIHEDSAFAFPLDIADLFREEIALDSAFVAVKRWKREPHVTLEAHARRTAGHTIRKQQVVPRMIDRIKAILEDDPRAGPSPPVEEPPSQPL